MGYIYEELLRRFSEQSGDEAGEHFTPREVIVLMVELLGFPIPTRHFSVYDPAGGTGGMVSVAKEHLLERANTADERDRVEKLLTVHAQELSPTNYAVCRADLLIKNDKQATVHLGNSLTPAAVSNHRPATSKSPPNSRRPARLSGSNCSTTSFSTAPGISAFWRRGSFSLHHRCSHPLATGNLGSSTGVKLAMLFQAFGNDDGNNRAHQGRAALEANLACEFLAAFLRPVPKSLSCPL